MKLIRRWLPSAVLLAVVSVAAYAATMTGTIVDQKDAQVGNLTGDHSKHLSADNPAVFVSESDGKIYTLKNGARADTLLGKRVTIQGEVDGTTIKVESIMEVPKQTGG